jgi:hypothetical protein
MAVEVDTLLRDSLRIERIIISGNQRTIDEVILRELMVKTGDLIPAMVLEELLAASRRNLLNTSLFNFVKIHTLDRGNDRMWVYINLTERWYIWPAPIFEIADRNFNSWWKARDWSRLNSNAHEFPRSTRGASAHGSNGYLAALQTCIFDSLHRP